MHIHLIIPTDERNLQDIKWFFLGLRQQTLDPEHWSVWIVHRGQEAALTQVLSPWRQRLGLQVTIQTLVLAAETFPGVAINTCLNRLRQEQQSGVTLILQPGFQPHRYLLEHHQRYHQQNQACIALGSSQYEPEQALSFWGMASQLEQLCFNFFPQASTGILPHSACHLHNLSLPLNLWLPLNEDFASWRFCAWDLALRWWCRGQRLQPRHDLRSCLMSPAGFESMTQQWQFDCQQDLFLYLQQYPYPLVPWELQFSKGDLSEIPDVMASTALQKELQQTQHMPCVFIESDTSVEKALLQWRSKLRRFWRGLALQVLQTQAESETRAKDSLTICPYPWRQVDSSADFHSTDPLWQEWLKSDLAACQALIKALPDACLGMGHLPEIAQYLPIPFADSSSFQTLLSPETQAVFFMAKEFPDLLSAFLVLNQSVQAGSLLALAPLKSKAIQDLQRLILSHYDWIELDTLAQTVILCRVST